MGVPVLSDAALAEALTSGPLNALRAKKFLRLCPTVEQADRVLALIEDVTLRSNWQAQLDAER